MALHLLYRPLKGTRRENGRHACLVDAVDEATARSLAGAPLNWAHHQMAATATMPGTHVVVWMEGDAVSLLGVDRGGNRI